MVRPGELHAAEQIEALRDVLPEPPASVLEVGCGHGELAGKLLAAGYEVTAIDPNPDAVSACQSRGVAARQTTLAEFHGPVFDAVVCSRSLHHIPDLVEASHQLVALLSDTGVLFIDEFDRAAADAATAAWFYGTRRLLTATGAAIEDEDMAVGVDPSAQWRHDHETDPPLHSGAEMLAALQTDLVLRSSRRGEGLWVYLCQWLHDTEQGGRLALELRELEASLLSTEVIVPVGLRFVLDVGDHSRHQTAS